MLVVHVHVRTRPGQVEEFLAATLANARASLTEPGDGEGWASSAP